METLKELVNKMDALKVELKEMQLINAFKFGTVDGYYEKLKKYKKLKKLIFKTIRDGE